MKKENKKEMDVVFLLDRSGSMKESVSDTIGGYNSYIENMKEKNVKVTTILFDDKYEIILEREDIKNVKELDNKTYFTRGCTALLDAIGKTINYMDNKDSKKVLFIITTDGIENASREFTKEKIKEMILGHSNWEFIYLGADIDSYQEASTIGIKKERISNYNKTRTGIDSMFKAIKKASIMYEENDCISDTWKNNIE